MKHVAFAAGAAILAATAADALGPAQGATADEAALKETSTRIFERDGGLSACRRGRACPPANRIAL